jgi:hypothetical protein
MERIKQAAYQRDGASMTWRTAASGACRTTRGRVEDFRRAAPA